MDGGVGDEAIDVAKNGGLRGKECDHLLKHDSGNMLESGQVVLLRGSNNYKSTTHAFDNILDSTSAGKIMNSGAASENYPHGPYNPVDDAIEELMVTNYKGENVATVCPSSSIGKTHIRQYWQHPYQLEVGLGSGRPHTDVSFTGNAHPMSSASEDVEYSSFSEFLAHKSSYIDCSGDAEELTSNKAKEVSVITSTPEGTRTKILSKSGFSEFFVKSTLKGKGVIYRGPSRNSVGEEYRGQSNTRLSSVTSNASLTLSTRAAAPSSLCITGPESDHIPDYSGDGVCLREWLKHGRNVVSRVDSLFIFKQIVEWVDCCHSQGIAMQELQPSCFKLLPSNRVKFFGKEKDTSYSSLQKTGKKRLEQGGSSSVVLLGKRHKFSQNANFNSCQTQFSSRSGFTVRSTNAVGMTADAQNYERKCSSSSLFGTARQLSACMSEQLEEKWYTCPEELNRGGCTFSANIYCLGVLLFELLASFESEEAHVAAMSDLHHQILPPSFLAENPKEAGLCLWLIHPEPASRPTTRDILQSDIATGIQDVCGVDLASSIDQEEDEAELLLHFLVLLNEQKGKKASNLVEQIRFLETDIEDIQRRRSSYKSSASSCTPGDYCSNRETEIVQEKYVRPEFISWSSHICSNESRIMNNFSQIESTYFAMRSKVQHSATDVIMHSDKDLLESRVNWHPAQTTEGMQKPTDQMGAFFDGLCKYARYSKVEVRGILRNGDSLNSGNVICSLGFDRDEEYFAAAGVSKKIKIFEFLALLNDSVDVHYPVVEMSNKSKLSCVCWNNYIKNFLATTDYDGAVKLWDVSTGQEFSQHFEHQKRAWSVDFSEVNPTKFASGSDDCCVKLWSINEKNSIDTIRNIANVCCVQFSAHSSNLLAFGSADYNTYCYDLRNARTPWCVLAGHRKAVSYVKFVDSKTIVSASTDNTLKLWDLNRSTSGNMPTNACSLTLSGHTNEKNFVGLSVADGYIVCGSETNEVYAYYKSLPMPITSHKFGSVEPISGKWTDDENGHFVSSVCWRGKSDMVIAANSSGCIKVLQMV